MSARVVSAHICFFLALGLTGAGAGTPDVDSCPNNFDFQNASAKQLTDCVKGFHAWIDGLATRLGVAEQAINNHTSKITVFSSGTVSPPTDTTHPKVTDVVGVSVSVDESSTGVKGEYKLHFQEPSAVVPVVIVGAIGTSKLVGCGVTDVTNSNDFFVRCNDKDGGTWAPFWFAALAH